MPIGEQICHFNFQKTISTLVWEIHITARNDYTVEFEFLHTYTKVVLQDRQQDEPSFSLKVSFHGEISTDPRVRPVNVFHFPFYYCFLEEAPPWLDDALPHDIFAPSIEQLLEMDEFDREYAAAEEWQYNSD